MNTSAAVASGSHLRACAGSRAWICHSHVLRQRPPRQPIRQTGETREHAHGDLDRRADQAKRQGRPSQAELECEVGQQSAAHDCHEAADEEHGAPDSAVRPEPGQCDADEHDKTCARSAYRDGQHGFTCHISRVCHRGVGR